MRRERVVRVLVCVALLFVGAALPAQEAIAPVGMERFMVTSPDGRPVVFWHSARDEAITRALAETTREFIPAPIAALDLRPDTFQVVVAPSEASFVQLTGGRVPDWGLAVAFPMISRIVIRSPRLTGRAPVDPSTVLRHELGHLYLAAAVGDPGDLPRWFHEGFAALYADEWRWVAPVQLAWSRVTGRLVPLGHISDSIPTVGDPSIAYVQSMAAVRDLRERGGDEAVARLLAQVGSGASFDRAMRETYGLSLGQFYASWDEELRKEYGWLVALTDQRGVWVVLTLVVAVLWIARRRAIRREIARRRVAEDAALGDPADHTLGVEEQDRTWEQEDDGWRGEAWRDEDDEANL